MFLGFIMGLPIEHTLKGEYVMATKNRKAELLKDFDAKIAEVNLACAKGTNADVEGKLSELVNIEKEYRDLRQSEVFAGLLDTHQAIELHHFTTIGHKKVTDEGRMTGIEKAERTVQIDLKKFCEVKGFSLDWFYELQALNKRLTLRVAEAIGVTAAEMKKIDDSYNMDKLASEIQLGKTPTSDTQVVKHMQKVLDMLSPNEGKVNGHDLGYVMACYTKRNNRNALRVQCSKHTMLLSLMGDVFYRIVTKGVYGVDYKRNGGSVTEPKEEKGSVPKTKKASKPRVKKAKEVKVSEPEPMTARKEPAAA